MESALSPTNRSTSTPLSITARRTSSSAISSSPSPLTVQQSQSQSQSQTQSQTLRAQSPSQIHQQVVSQQQLPSVTSPNPTNDDYGLLKVYWACIVEHRLDTESTSPNTTPPSSPPPIIHVSATAASPAAASSASARVSGGNSGGTVSHYGSGGGGGGGTVTNKSGAGILGKQNTGIPGKNGTGGSGGSNVASTPSSGSPLVSAQSVANSGSSGSGAASASNSSGNSVGGGASSAVSSAASGGTSAHSNASGAVAPPPRTGVFVPMGDVTKNSTSKVRATVASTTPRRSLTAPVVRVTRRMKRPRFAPIENNTWISTIQLSMYSSSLGPHLAEAWRGVEEFSEEMQQFFVIAALADCVQVLEFNGDDVNSGLQLKLIVLPTQHFLCSVTFTAMVQGSGKICALTIFARQEYLPRFLEVYPRALDRLGVAACRLCLLISQDSDTTLQIHKEIEAMCTSLNVLMLCIIPLPSSPHSDLNTITNLWGADFVSLAVTSHLQTMCCTVVIGDMKEHVNMFVNALSIFEDDTQRAKSSLVVDKRPYSPDLLLQGVVGSASQITDDLLFQSPLPTTVIDLKQITVTQVAGFHIFKKRQKDHIKAEVEKCLPYSNIPIPVTVATGGPNAVNAANAANGLQAEYVADRREPLNSPSLICSSLVTNMIYELHDLPYHLQPAVVHNWMHLFSRYAVTLVLLANKLQPTATTSSDGMFKKICAGLNLSEADAIVILAVAEKISPGIHLHIFGNCVTIEDNFVAIFDGFV
ncbi:C9orf72-like protein family [Pelomyxa schiedti]|nr:C9orf72-like protein family [Pelomyxa schiedti]